MRIGCLHTAESNVVVLERAASGLGVQDLVLRHEVRPDLLSALEAAGSLTQDIVDDTSRALLALAGDCDAVVLTCSSLGAVVNGLAASLKPILRLDQALADHAVAGGGIVRVLCTAPSSIEATRALVLAAAEGTGARVEVVLIDGAWAQFKAGQMAGYFSLISAAIDRGLESGVTVALGQASMADVPNLHPAVLTSPVIGLRTAVARAGSIVG